MNGYGALLLAAAAGLNPWLTLVIAVGLATYTQHAPLTPGFEPFVGNALLGLLAVLLGVDVAASKVPRFMRTTERVSGLASAVAGAILCLAVPNALLEWGWAAAALGGALLATVFRLGRRWAALALAEPMGRYRFGYAFASMATNLGAAILTSLTFAVGP